MKHIALLLAILIFAFSAISCGDLTYYKDAGWNGPREEFHQKYHEPISAKIQAVAQKYELDLRWRSRCIEDDGFSITMYDDAFECRLDFISEQLWATYTAQMWFFGDDEGSLGNYSAQKKYVDYTNEIVQLFAYGVDNTVNIFETSYNECVENGKTSYSKRIHSDSMLGELRYGVSMYNSEYIGYHPKKEAKCNAYYFKGLLNGNVDFTVAN